MLVLNVYQDNELVMTWEVNKNRADNLRLKDVVTKIKEHIADAKIKAEYKEV